MHGAFRHHPVGTTSNIRAQVLQRRGLIEGFMLLQGPLHFAGFNQSQIVKADFLRILMKNRHGRLGMEFPNGNEDSSRQKHQYDYYFLCHEPLLAMPTMATIVNVAGDYDG